MSGERGFWEEDLAKLVNMACDFASRTSESLVQVSFVCIRSLLTLVLGRVGGMEAVLRYANESRSIFVCSRSLLTCLYRPKEALGSIKVCVCVS